MYFTVTLYKSKKRQLLDSYAMWIYTTIIAWPVGKLKKFEVGEGRAVGGGGEEDSPPPPPPKKN